MPEFHVVSEYSPAGDQPQAIEKLAEGVAAGLDEQTLLGVTGSGKTYTMAKVIERVQKPTLVLAHNKTLAAQLCSEFKEFFPDNAVEYFVSYYDYYQPEAYIPHTDTYIEKDASTNEEIDRLRLSATFSLLERRDVIVVASVSCIYGLGEPDDFARMAISLRPGSSLPQEELLKKLIDCRSERNDIAFERNMFRVRGDTVEIFPAYWRDKAIRVEYFGDEIERISEINPLTGAAVHTLSHTAIYPASHYVTPPEKMARAVQEIRRVVLPLSAQQQNAARAFVADDGAAKEDHGTHHVSRRSRFRDGRDELRHSDRGEPPARAVRRRSLCRRDHGRKLAADDLHRDHPRLRLRHPAGARF